MKKIVLGFAAFLVLLQFIPAQKTNPPIDPKKTLSTDTTVLSLLKKVVTIATQTRRSGPRTPQSRRSPFLSSPTSTTDAKR